MTAMKAVKVRVENGHITGEAPAGLAAGEHDLCLADDADDMIDEDLALLDAAIERSWQDAKAGRVVAADEVVAELHARR
jgi:hypothetical protein